MEFFFPLSTCTQIGITPDGNLAAPLQRHEVRLQMLQHLLVFACITTEYFKWDCHNALPALVEMVWPNFLRAHRERLKYSIIINVLIERSNKNRESSSQALSSSSCKRKGRRFSR